MWKTIQSEPNYEVSTEGLVRNKETKHVKGLRNSKSGYLRVTLYPSGKTYNVHRLVAETFLEYWGGLVVNHKDGDKVNNKLSNLEWVTLSQNCRNAYEKGLNKNKPKGPVKFVPKGLIQRIRYGDLKGVCMYELSNRFGFHYVTFRDIINNKTYKKI